MKKLRLMFRWTFVFVLLGMLHVHANVYPQNGQQVTLSMKAASLKDVLWAIERQTSFVFMYNEEDLDKIGKVDVDVQGDDIRTILNVCLKGTTLTYVLQDNVIVLKPTIPQKTVKEVLLKGKVVDEKKGAATGGDHFGEGNFCRCCDRCQWTVCHESARNSQSGIGILFYRYGAERSGI